MKDNFTALTTEPVHRLINKLAGPTIISMLVTSFYVVADTYFVGKLNIQSVAAVGIVFAVMAVIQALGFFFGHGSGNYISRELGAKRNRNAEVMAANGFFAGLFSGVGLMLLGAVYLEDISVFLGSTDTILPYTKDYLSIILLGAPFMISSFVLSVQLRFQGHARLAMAGVLTGAVLNIALDPVLIFAAGMGLKGAAWATLISQMVSFLIMMVLNRKYSVVPVNFRNIHFSLDSFKEIFNGGAPSLCRQVLVCIASVMLNVYAGRYAGDYGDAPIAAMSIVSRITMFINAFVIGFGQGFQPVCGYNYGAGLYTRVRSGFWYSVKVGVLFMIVCSSLGFLFSEQLVGIFAKQDENVIAVGAIALRWQLVAMPLGVWVILCNMFLQTIRRSTRAIILSSARQGIFFIPLMLLLPRWYGLFGVQICQAVADIFSFLLAVPMVWSVLASLKKDKPLSDGQSVDSGHMVSDETI